MVFAFVAISNAQTPKDQIEENGYVFTRVKTLDALKALGYEINMKGTDGLPSALAKARKARPNFRCGAGSGGCLCNAIVVKNGEITSVNFPKQTPEGGETVDGVNNVIPYYNESVGIIFR